MTFMPRFLHARAAVLQGQQGYPDDFVKHAEEALTHADMAKKETSSPQLDEGIKLLKEAVTEAKNGYLTGYGSSILISAPST